MRSILLKQFDEKYNQPDTEWNFKKFKIVCVKCGSDNVEYNGVMETEYGYYQEFDVHHLLVVKCHDCGNAFAMKNTDGGVCECEY